jgi:hypothetical protein
MAGPKAEFTAEELARIWPKLKEVDPAVRAWPVKVIPDVFRKVLGDLQIPDLNPAPTTYKSVLTKLRELAEPSAGEPAKASGENAGAANPKAAVGDLFAGRAAAAPAAAPAVAPAAAPAGPGSKGTPSVNLKGSTTSAGDMAQRLMDHANQLHAEDTQLYEKYMKLIETQNKLLLVIAQAQHEDNRDFNAFFEKEKAAMGIPVLSPAAAAGAEGAASGKGGNRRNRRLYGGARSRRLRRAFGTRKTRKSH